jgi:hypothetical protein
VGSTKLHGYKVAHGGGEGHEFVPVPSHQAKFDEYRKKWEAEMGEDHGDTMFVQPEDARPLDKKKALGKR